MNLLLIRPYIFQNYCRFSKSIFTLICIIRLSIVFGEIDVIEIQLTIPVNYSSSFMCTASSLVSVGLVRVWVRRPTRVVSALPPFGFSPKILRF